MTTPDLPPPPPFHGSVSHGECPALLDWVLAYGAACAAAEREAAAQLADEYATWGGSNFAKMFLNLAAAIRTRGAT